MLMELPSEIILKIVSFVSCRDLAVLRLVSKNLRTCCDLPRYWTTLHLEPGSIPLWQLADLKSIISPHLPHIQSIYIWGVRDNIIYYLLSRCKNLQHLTICGWTTLSDHCLRLQPAQSLKIKTLELIGSPQQTNFISVDAYTLGNLMIQSPEMTNLVLGCEAHIHAETLVAELEKAYSIHSSEGQLQSFQLASRRTWLKEHILRLIRIYPDIQKIYLLPAAAAGIGSSSVLKEGFDLFDAIISQKLNQTEVIPTIYYQYPLVVTDDMLLYNRKMFAY